MLALTARPDAPVRRSPRSLLKARIASSFCLVPAAYCAGVAAFALRNFQDYATAWPQFIRYIAVPASLCVLFVCIALYASRTRRIAIGGAGIAILLALFAFELRLEAKWVAALEGLIHVPSYGALTSAGLARGLPPAMTVRRLNEALSVQRTGEAMLGGVPGENVLLCKSGKSTLTYRADRFGFRNPDFAHDRPVDLMLVGDSFVEGICLPSPSDLVGTLRATGRSVIGTGIRGAGPLLELAILERFGPILRPRRTVIVFYEGNDWENLRHEVGYTWLQDALARPDAVQPVPMSPTTRNAAARVIRAWAAGDTPDAARLLGNTNLIRNTLALHQTWTQLGLGYPGVPPTMPVYAEILAQARRTASRWGGAVTLVYVPQSSRFVGLIPDRFVYDQLRDQVAEAARRNGIPFVDLAAAFARHPARRKLFANDGHFSRQGAALAAATLVRALEGHDPLVES